MVKIRNPETLSSIASDGFLIFLSYEVLIADSQLRSGTVNIFYVYIFIYFVAVNMILEGSKYISN